jgi:probable F420-dependent oxidoreductase
MMKIGRLGVWYPVDRLTEAPLRSFLAHVEHLGYDALWYPEALVYESLSLGAFLLGATKRLTIGSSIANIYARDPFTARRGVLTLQGLYGDRYVLGLGVSHAPIVEGVRGHHYAKPVPAMRNYLNKLLESHTDSSDWPIVLAALGPRMLALAAVMTRGAVPYSVTPEHTRRARAILGPEKWLIVEQKVSLEENPDSARHLGRMVLSRTVQMPSYRDNWLRLGYAERDFESGGSDLLIDALFYWGNADSVKRRLCEHFAAGADQVCIQPVHPEGDTVARDRILTVLADT